MLFLRLINARLPFNGFMRFLKVENFQMSHCSPIFKCFRVLDTSVEAENFQNLPNVNPTPLSKYGSAMLCFGELEHKRKNQYPADLFPRSCTCPRRRCWREPRTCRTCLRTRACLLSYDYPF